MSKFIFKYKNVAECPFSVQWGAGDAYWEGYIFLAYAISTIVLKLSETNTGYPGKIYKAAHEALGYNFSPFEWERPECVEVDTLATQMWKDTLLAIAEGFVVYTDGNIIEEANGKYAPEIQEKVDKAWDLFREYFNHLWD